MSFKLEGKRIVITGASRGLGRAIALLFSRMGAEVALLARNTERLARVEQEIREQGGECFWVSTQVGEYESVRAAFSEIYRRWDRVDGLVNNAAIIEPLGLTASLDPDAWRNNIDVNLNGAFFCAHEALKSMMDGEGGCIINVTSGLARFVFPNFSAYSTAKSGLNTLTLYLAQELASYGIRVFGMDPGVMDTDMQAYVRNTDAALIGEETLNIFWGYKKRGELNPPERSATLALFLMADAGAELSGQVGGVSHFSQYGYNPDASLSD